MNSVDLDLTDGANVSLTVKARAPQVRPAPTGRGPHGRWLVDIVQQGAWNSSRESMPLAAGYLKAAASSDPVIGAKFDLDIINFRGGTDVRDMAQQLALRPPPAVLAFSVLGWNYRAFGELATTYKQRHPDGIVIYGGTHVAHQGERVFRQYPAVDVIADGEGEVTFVELLRWFDNGSHRADLGQVLGISYANGRDVMSTPEQPRIDDLDSIASPLLTGSVPMLGADGTFRYDVALMETNRGCPYRCAFCYWGGAIGTRVREFSRERLRAELEYLAAREVETVVLCDANFGMRRADLEFVEDLLDVRRRTGFPRYLETSWAKNKSATFYEIVRRLKAASVHSSFTLALQTLDPAVLESMLRRNMQLNDWIDVARWLAGEGLEAYAELIWGAPGETVDSFFRGYDQLAAHLSRVAVYPLLVLPNTGYLTTRVEDELQTVRGADDDFEYVLSHRTMTVEENIDVQRFLFWARLFAENLYFRNIWLPLRVLAGLTQSEVILRLAAYVDHAGDPLGDELVALCRPFADSATNRAATAALYRSTATTTLFARWWEEDIMTTVDDEATRSILHDLFRYDELTRPLFDPTGLVQSGELTIEPDGQLVRAAVTFDWHMEALLAAVREAVDQDTPFEPPERGPWTAAIRYRAGFSHDLDNHEMAAHFVGEVHGWRLSQESRR